MFFETSGFQYDRGYYCRPFLEDTNNPHQYNPTEAVAGCKDNPQCLAFYTFTTGTTCYQGKLGGYALCKGIGTGSNSDPAQNGCIYFKGKYGKRIIKISYPRERFSPNRQTHLSILIMNSNLCRKTAKFN